MLLCDTSVWIDFFRRAQTPAVAVLVDTVKAERTLYMCAPVLQEILQGAVNTEQFDRFRRYLTALPLLVPDDAGAHAVAAARLYQACRRAGRTIRSSNDCAIAALAVEHRITLLHSDQDYREIALIEPALIQSDGRER